MAVFIGATKGKKEVKKGDIITLKNSVRASYTNKLIPSGTKLILKATPPFVTSKSGRGRFVYAITLDGKEEVRTEKSNFRERIKNID